MKDKKWMRKALSFLLAVFMVTGSMGTVLTAAVDAKGIVFPAGCIHGNGQYGNSADGGCRRAGNSADGNG